ncbi:MAG: MATE family efflux transporter [Kiritimatiellae bacterium]|nr:MATE family efflux transporter [Kiritimatiellia bacterium]MDW8457747.1 MATE family efflux transporter [Verrucomicrobiota bacterium]
MNLQDLTSGPIRSQIRRIAIPAAAGMFFNTLYNLTDTFFAGRISTWAVAGLSISFPLFFGIIAVGAGLGAGATALIANALGRGDRDEARMLAAQALSVGLALSAALSVVGWVAAEPLFSALGAQGEYLRSAVTYIRWIYAGAVFFIGSYAANAGLVAGGDTRALRNVMAIGAAANVVLDPWFIYGGLGVPAMGFVGIAAATLVIQAGGFLYLCRRAAKVGLLGRFSIRHMFPKPPYVRLLLGQGGPAALNHLTIGIGIFVITGVASRFGEAAVAAYGVATRIEQLVLLPALGLTSATLAIAGQCHGAGLVERMAVAWRAALRDGFVAMAAGGAVVWAFAPELMSLFARDAGVVAIGAGYLRIAVFVLWAYVVLFVTVSLLQAVRQPMYALWIGLYRQIAAPLAVYPVLASALGPVGLWLGIAAVTWSAALFTLWWGHRVLRQLIRARDLSSKPR